MYKCEIVWGIHWWLVKIILITLSPLKLRLKILDFRFLINHNHVTVCRWTLIFRFLRVVWPELSDEDRKNNFSSFYKISIFSRFGANVWTLGDCTYPKYEKINSNCNFRLSLPVGTRDVQSRYWVLIQYWVLGIGLLLNLEAWLLISLFSRTRLD